MSLIRAASVLLVFVAGACLFVTFSLGTHGSEPGTGLPPAAKEVLKQLDQGAADIRKQTKVPLQEQRDRTAAGLKKVQDALSKEDKLDEAIVVRDLIRTLRGGSDNLTCMLPQPASEVYKRHEHELARIHNKAEAELKKRRDKAARDLKKVQEAPCKESRLDDAVAVHDLIRVIDVSNGQHKPLRAVRLPDAVEEVHKQFERETAEIEKKTEVEVTKRREKTAAELKNVQDDCCKDSKLDEAVDVRDLIQDLLIGRDRDFDSDLLPPAAREVHDRHETAMVEINKKARDEFRKKRNKVVVELKKLEVLFTRDGKLDEAVAVRDLIGMIRSGVKGALPDPGNVNNLAADIGQVYYYKVTGVVHTAGYSIYGTEVYTTGSHLGMAAVHCGILKAGQTGVVRVTILPGQANYTASTRNGVTSIAYGQWGVSFKVEQSYGFVVR